MGIGRLATGVALSCGSAAFAPMGMDAP